MSGNLITEAQKTDNLAVADILGDVLGCGQECLCSTCRQEIERALALVELGTDNTEEI